MGSTMKHEVSFYACGTPGNERGFEYVDLGPVPLPGEPKNYLDLGLGSRHVGFHDFRRLKVSSADYVAYTQLIPIQPSDSRTTRGAYLASGFLAGNGIPLNVLENCVALTFEIMGALRGQMDGNQRLPVDFRMRDFRYGRLSAEELTHQCPPSLVCDIFLQAMHGSGRFDNNRSLAITAQDFQAAGSNTEFTQFTRNKEDGLAAVRALDVQKALVQECAGDIHAANGQISELIDAWRAIQDDVGDRLQRLSARTQTLRSGWQDALGRAAELDRIPSQEMPATPRLHAPAQAPASRPFETMNHDAIPGTVGGGRRRRRPPRVTGPMTSGALPTHRRNNIMAGVTRLFSNRVALIAAVFFSAVILGMVLIFGYNWWRNKGDGEPTRSETGTHEVQPSSSSHAASDPKSQNLLKQREALENNADPKNP